MRSLVIDAVKAGASRYGVWFEVVSGGALELRFSTELGYQIFRLKSAKRTARGELVILANKASRWGDIDEETLIYEQHCVLGYVTSADGVGEIFVAEVRGVEDGVPGRLILGPETALGDDDWGPSQGGFKPDADDSLPGFDEREEELEGDLG